MPGRPTDSDGEIWRLVIEDLAQRVAEYLAPRLAHLASNGSGEGSPWLTTREAVAYSKLPEGTFRKLASSGKIPSHGGRTKVFYRPEIDDALLDYAGATEEHRRLRSVR
jgi:hypothetical protein